MSQGRKFRFLFFWWELLEGSKHKSDIVWFYSERIGWLLCGECVEEEKNRNKVMGKSAMTWVEGRHAGLAYAYNSEERTVSMWNLLWGRIIKPRWNTGCWMWRK